MAIVDMIYTSFSDASGLNPLAKQVTDNIFSLIVGKLVNPTFISGQNGQAVARAGVLAFKLGALALAVEVSDIIVDIAKFIIHDAILYHGKARGVPYTRDNRKVAGEFLLIAQALKRSRDIDLFLLGAGF